MRKAKSAKAVLALGATLVAIAAPVNAEDQGSRVFGITAGGVEGITAGGVQGITAGGVQGITAGGVQGITAGGVQGITAGGVQGITAGGVQGITAGGVQGITAGGLQGITAGGVQGITAGGVQGITAGGLQGITAGGVQGITAGGVQGITAGGILAGPVDRIDRVNGVFESMGQVVLASQDMLAGMTVGDFVSVEGSVVSPGWLYADTLDVSSTPYVAGATEVFVTGMLSSVDRIAGTAQIGGLTIDYTPSLSGGEAPSGTMWSFTGIRPTADGAMLSDRSIVRR